MGILFHGSDNIAFTNVHQECALQCWTWYNAQCIMGSPEPLSIEQTWSGDPCPFSYPLFRHSSFSLCLSRPASHSASKTWLYLFFFHPAVPKNLWYFSYRFYFYIYRLVIYGFVNSQITFLFIIPRLYIASQPQFPLPPLPQSLSSRSTPPLSSLRKEKASQDINQRTA